MMGPIPDWLTLEAVYLFGFGVGTLWICIAIYIQVVARIPPRGHIWAFYGVGMATVLLGSRAWIPEDNWLLWSRLLAFGLLFVSASVFFKYVSEKEAIPPPGGLVWTLWRKAIKWVYSR